MNNRELFKYAQGLGYRVEPDGRIIGARGREISGFVSSTGYRDFAVSAPRISRYRGSRIPVHRMQAYQKYGDRIFEEGIVVRHLDGDKTNNSWDNILVGTASENRFDIPEEHRRRLAVHAASFLRKLSSEQVKEMRRLRTVEKLPYAVIGIKFGIKSKGHVHAIVNNEIYKS